MAFAQLPIVCKSVNINVQNICLFSGVTRIYKHTHILGFYLYTSPCVCTEL